MASLKRALPKITWKDLDWKLIALLAVLLAITWGDDITVIGELFDPVELVIDVIVAYLVGKKAMEAAIHREESTVVEGKVVEK